MQQDFEGCIIGMISLKVQWHFEVRQDFEEVWPTTAEPYTCGGRLCPTARAMPIHAILGLTKVSYGIAKSL